MAWKLSELFVEITAPLDKLNSSLKEAQANLDNAAAAMGASASVDLGRAVTGGMDSSLSGLSGAIGVSFAAALLPLQSQVANLGQIIRRSAVQGGGSLQRLTGQFQTLLHAMDNILARQFDRELAKQLKVAQNPVWTKWLQGVQALRRLQNQAEFTRASLTRAASAAKGMIPFRGLFASRPGAFGVPSVEGVRSSRFASALPKNPFAKPPPESDFGGRAGMRGGGGSARQYSVLPAVAATAAVAGGMTKAVSLASDLSETVSKVGVVFGESASIVTGAADKMGSRFGVPKRQMMDAVSIMGLMAKGAGASEQAAAQFGVSLATLGLDAASFYNVPLDTALEKIRAGLSGEAEPLRAFGVFLTEDAVKAQAARMGLARYGAELTEGQKIMARSVLISQGLSDAQGDLERTQGGYANQTRELWGRLENLASMIGESLLPAFTDLISSTNDTVQSFELGFGKMKHSAEGFVNFFKGAVETIGVVYRNWGAIVERTGVMIGGWWVNLGETIAWLGETIAALLNFVSNHWRDAFMMAFDAVTTALINLGQNFRDFGSSVYDWIASGFTKPFELTITPIMEGFNSAAYGFEMPKLNLSSVEDQLAEIDNRMVATEQKFQDEMAKSETKADTAKKKAAGMNSPMAKEKKDARAEFVGIAEFARRIQSGTLEKDKTAKDHLGEARKSNELLSRIAENIRKPRPARAA